MFCIHVHWQRTCKVGNQKGTKSTEPLMSKIANIHIVYSLVKLYFIRFIKTDNENSMVHAIRKRKKKILII